MSARASPAEQFPAEIGMDERLQKLIDRFEIIDVLNEYVHGCDRLDEPRMAGVYWPDSWDDHGPDKCEGPEFSRRIIATLQNKSLMCSHQLGQSIIHVDGDVAGAETYFIASVRFPGDPETLNQMGGRYVDQLERRAGRWRIKHRTCIREWSITLPVEQDWLKQAGFVEGVRARSDPSYQTLGLLEPDREPTEAVAAERSGGTTQ
jgi:hypothetical protein